MNRKGFTLIELIIVIVILGVLAAVVIPKYIDMRKDAELAVANSTLSALQTTANAGFAKYILNPIANEALYNFKTIDLLTAQVDEQNGIELKKVSGAINIKMSASTYIALFTKATPTTPAIIEKDTANWPVSTP